MPTMRTPSFLFPEEITPKFELPQRERKKKQTQESGFNAYAYIDATKKQKAYWKKLNEQPLTKRSALSLSAQEVDSTISARGKVTKTKGKPIDTGEDYFMINRNKFRTYQSKKGKRIEMPNSFIERQKYRLDSPMEVRKIQKAKSELRSMFGFYKKV
jgi:hypothetical protein